MNYEAISTSLLAYVLSKSLNIEWPRLDIQRHKVACDKRDGHLQSIRDTFSFKQLLLITTLSTYVDFPLLHDRSVVSTK